MFKFFVFSILCVCTLADTIIPYRDCAEHFLCSKNESGELFSYHVYRQWDDNYTFNAFFDGWKVVDGENKTYKAVMRSDLYDDPLYGAIIEHLGSKCEESFKVRPSKEEFNYQDSPTEVQCPDGSSGCHKYENFISYIILDAKNRIVRSSYGMEFTYFDDYPTMNMFAVKFCDGTKAPDPIKGICPGTSSSASSFPSYSSGTSSLPPSAPSSLLPSAPSSSSHASSSVLVVVAAALVALIALF